MEKQDSNEIINVDIECPKGKLNCIYDDSVCSSAPCEINKFRFGIHERIIEYFLSKSEFDKAYFFHVDLIHIFHINCDSKNKEGTDLSPGCKIFATLENLHRLKKQINAFAQYEPLDQKQISKSGKDNYERTKTKFTDEIFKNMKRLGRLVMDTKNTRFERDEEHKKVLESWDKTFEASKKYGMIVKPPDIFEQAFAKSAEASGTYSTKHAQVNRDRISQAKTDVERENLIQEIQKQLKETGKISPDLQQKLVELQRGE